MSRVQARHLHLVQPSPAREPRRFHPARGQLLTLANIRGPWRTSGAVAGAGVFAVVWSTRGGDFWAALHDFDDASRSRLIDACRWQDLSAGRPGAWADGERL
jgi:hypothetical protein